MKSGENCSSFSEKKAFKDYEIFIHVYCPGAMDITPGDKILFVTKRVCYFDNTLLVSAISLLYILRN